MDATPLTESVALKVTVTAERYHPFAPVVPEIASTVAGPTVSTLIVGSERDELRHTASNQLLGASAIEIDSLERCSRVDGLKKENCLSVSGDGLWPPVRRQRYRSSSIQRISHERAVRTRQDDARFDSSKGGSLT